MCIRDRLIQTANPLTSALNGGLTAMFTTVPVTNLLIILVGMPLVAAIGGWIFAGRQPRDLGHQPLE